MTLKIVNFIDFKIENLKKCCLLILINFNWTGHIAGSVDWFGTMSCY